MDAQAAVADAKAAAIHAKEKIGDLHKDLQKKMKGTKNWVTNSDYFKSAVKQAFEAVDLDSTNSVDFKELYAAVLMLYLKVTKIVRGATPPTAQDIQKLMDEVDTSGTGSLDLDGFTTGLRLERVGRRAHDPPRQRAHGRCARGGCGRRARPRAVSRERYSRRSRTVGRI